MKNLLWVTRMAPAEIDSAGLILQYRQLEILSKYYNILVMSNKADYGTVPLKKLNIRHVKYKNEKTLLEVLNQEKFDAAVICWWDLAASCLQPIFKKVFGKVIINTIDVEFVRSKRKEALGIKTPNTRMQELQTYSWAKKLWFVTEEDKAAVTKDGKKEINCDVFPIIQKPITGFKNYDLVHLNHLYFIGNFLHQPNLDAATILCRDIFPKVLNLFPEMKLFIIGKWPPRELQLYRSDNIDITGIVYDLENRLIRLGICIANLRWGAGLKGKVCEAMSYGIPVIGTDIAFEGINVVDKENGLKANTVDEFVNQIRLLHEDYNLYRRISKNSREYMKSLSADVIGPRLIQSVEEVINGESNG